MKTAPTCFGARIMRSLMMVWLHWNISELFCC